MPRFSTWPGCQRLGGHSKPYLASQTAELVAPHSSALHRSLPRASPEMSRSLAIAPLIGDKRCYGEAPAHLRQGSGGLMVV